MSAHDDEQYEALLAWAVALPYDTAAIEARVGTHTGSLSIYRSASGRVSVRVRDSRKTPTKQYQGVLPHHLADGGGARFQIRASNGRYVNWTAPQQGGPA